MQVPHLLALTGALLLFKDVTGFQFPLNNTRVGSNKDVVVELMIVCDKSFSDRFQQNRQKMMEFWSGYMWDVNMRFKTLPSVNISVRVVSLFMMKNKTEQPFVERARINDKTIKMEDTLYNFAEYLYAHRTKLLSFDIAVLVTGEVVIEKDAKTYSYIQSACQKNHVTKKSTNAIVLDFNFIGGNYCGALETALARMLGAPWDSGTNVSSTCKSHTYLMSKSICSEKSFFFSECSDTGISQHLKTEKASCVHFGHDTSVDVLSKGPGNVIHPPSFQDQCIILTNNKNAMVSENIDSCFKAHCYTSENGTMNFLKSIYPIDNTQCGTYKNCFRGRCLPTGMLLQNVGSGKCLHSSNKFSSGDNLVMVDCPESPTPLDTFVIRDKGLQGKSLATPYSCPLADENEDKCLVVNSTLNSLQYQKCSSLGAQHFLWDFIKVNLHEDEYLLFHNRTKTCAQVAADLSVKGTRACVETDSFTRWKIYNPLYPLQMWSEMTTTMTPKPTETTTFETELKDVFTSTRKTSYKWSYGTSYFTTPFPANSQKRVQVKTMFGWGSIILTAVGFLFLGTTFGMGLIVLLQKYRMRGLTHDHLNFDNQCSVLYNRDTDILN